VAGYGWLGFQSRTVAVRDDSDRILGDTIVGYEAPEQWDPGEDTVPYNYVTTALAKEIVTIGPPADSPFTASAVAERVSTFTSLEWEERLSSAGLSFPALVGRTVAARVGEGSGVFDSFPLHRQTEELHPDQFGNVIVHVIGSEDLQGAPVPTPIAGSRTEVRVLTTFSPTAEEVNDWLISLPKVRDIFADPRCSIPGGCLSETKSRSTRFTYYPGIGLVHTIDREPIRPELARNTELFYDDAGNLTDVIVIDEDGNERHRATFYDERLLFPTAASALGGPVALTTQVRFDERFGALTARADPNGIDETHSYDEFGIQRHYRGPDGESELYYEAADTYIGDVAFPLEAATRMVLSQEGGGETQEEYNSFGQLVARRSAGLLGAEVKQEFEYDERQRLLRETRPHLPGDPSQAMITYVYDDANRLVNELHPDAITIHHQYGFATPALDTAFQSWVVPGAIGIVRSFDPVANPTVAVFDRGGQPVNVVDAVGGSTRYAYDAFGNASRITDPANRSIDIAHDGWGRLVSVDDAARGGPEVTVYNGLDEVVETNDAAGRLRSFFYDNLGRLERLEDPDGTTQWTFDGAGPNELDRLVEMVSPSGQRTTYDYEAVEPGRNRGLLNRITSHLLPPNDAGAMPRELVTGYQFDDFSRLERIDYPGDGGSVLSVQYSFDSAGNVVSAVNAGTPSEAFWELLEADQGYRIKTERLGTHSCGAIQGTITEREYEPLTGRVSRISTSCSDLVQDAAYLYDSSGDLRIRTDNVAGITEEFVYDPLHRLVITNGQPSHSYDSLRGRLDFAQGTGNYTYEPTEGRDWIQSAGNTDYRHDDVGNIIERSGPSVPGGTQTIDYTSFDLPSSITSGTSVTDIAYDALGSRAVKQGSSSATYYAGGLYQRLETAAGTAHRSMIYAGGRAIAQLDENGGARTLRFLHDDVLGSVQTVTGDDGTVETARDYASFGAQRAPNALESSLPYGFTGHESDAEFGLINMTGRIYDPGLGQFLSADPIISQPFSQGLNRFAYVNNSPLNFVDPSGLDAEGRDDELIGRGGGAGLFIGLGVVAAVATAGIIIGSNADVGGGLSGGAGSFGPGGVASGDGVSAALNVASIAIELHQQGAVSAIGPNARPILVDVGATVSPVGQQPTPSPRDAFPSHWAPVQELGDDSIARRPPPRGRGRGRSRGAAPPAPRSGPRGTELRTPVKPVRMGGPRLERFPEGDARTTPQGNVYLTPRGQQPPARDPVGDRLAEIAVEARRDYSDGWLTPQQRRQLDWNSWNPWRHERLRKLFAGQAIEREVIERAREDPIARSVVSRTHQRPGPDLQQAPGSNQYYEITTIRSLPDHLRRSGIRPPGGTVRFILYPGL
jgi:RHS repeat-associated protein